MNINILSKMDLKNIFLTLIACITITSLSAQPDKWQSLSFSFYPATLNMMKNSFKIFDEKPYEVVFGDYGYKAVGHSEENYFGAFSLEYKRYMSDCVRLNILLSCELSNKKWDIYDIPDGPCTKRIFDYRITAMPGIDYIYSDNKRSRVYGSANVGMEFLCRGLKYLDRDRRYQNNLAWQLMPVCLDVYLSESLSFTGALGYGTLGFLRLGLSYNF
ncbi:MAG: hypothetical protein FWD60_10435 [Candidatus Azobacteroides sp.]|nr:hypothetical protein [Candidatus Azobacteroides sp.]